MTSTRDSKQLYVQQKATFSSKTWRDTNNLLHLTVVR